MLPVFGFFFGLRFPPKFQDLSTLALCHLRSPEAHMLVLSAQGIAGFEPSHQNRRKLDR